MIKRSEWETLKPEQKLEHLYKTMSRFYAFCEIEEGDARVEDIMRDRGQTYRALEQELDDLHAKIDQISARMKALDGRR